MADWFEFKDVHSASLGVFMKTAAMLSIPKERATFEPIPGRSGTLTILEGENVFDDLLQSVSCRVSDLSTLDQIGAWLRGSGALVLGDMPDRYYKARCVNQIDLSKIIRSIGMREFNVVFRCSPHRYAYPEPPVQTFTTSPGSINNPGTADAIPLITIVGSGDIDLTVGTRTVHIAGLASAITIDCDTGMAYNGATDLTSTASLDYYPWAIPPGVSAVSWTGTVTSVTITRPWRYI